MISKTLDLLFKNAFKANKVASMDLLIKIAEQNEEMVQFAKSDCDQRNEISEILGTACLVMLKLDGAAKYFKLCGNLDNLKSVFELAARHGKHRLVKEIMTYGKDCGYSELQMERDEYLDFLKKKALPYVKLSFDEDNGFSIDEKALNEILSEITGITKEPREKILADAAKMMQLEGSLNVVKKFILAFYSQDQKLIETYQDEFDRMAVGGRKDAILIVKNYCKRHNLILVKTLQVGDDNNYFPSVANIFLLADGDGPGAKRFVLKENIRLHQDYSSLAGYSMEKEIFEAVEHDNDNIVKHLKSFWIGLDFMVLDFIPGVTLENYARPDNLLPFQKSLEIVKRLALIIDYLHSKNIISMDIKPKNVMYDGDKITLFDFGVSQIVGGREGSLTDDSYITSLLTTPEYVSPEMALTFQAYPKTDIFQLGILFYKLLVGKNPFVNYDIADFAEGDECRESEIIKFVLPAIFRGFDDSPEVIRANSKLALLLGAMFSKDIKHRPSPQTVASFLDNFNLGKED